MDSYSEVFCRLRNIFAMTDFAALGIPVDARIQSAVTLHIQPCCCVMGRMCAVKLTS